MALMVPTELLPEFYGFIESMYGVKPRVHEEPKRGEYARFMLGSAIVFVRDHDARSENAVTVEVFSSTTAKVEEIEKTWIPFLNSLLGESDNDNRTDHDRNGGSDPTDDVPKPGYG